MASEAAAHDKCFLEQVELAIAEADSPQAEWVTNENAQASWADQRAALTKRLAGGGG